MRTKKNAMRSAVTATPAKLPAMPAIMGVMLNAEVEDGGTETEGEAEDTVDVCAAAVFVGFVKEVSRVVVELEVSQVRSKSPWPRRDFQTH
jgi:hypothetical protein